MDDEEEIAFESEDDPLPHPAEPEDAGPFNSAKRRVNGADEEGARHANVLERLADRLRADGLDVDGEIGELGHARLARSVYSQKICAIASNAVWNEAVVELPPSHCVWIDVDAQLFAALT
jgi:hypothetical protein